MSPRSFTTVVNMVSNYDRTWLLIQLCIVIVVATNSEPIPGWIDNLYGATGVVVGCGTGVLRTLQCDERVCAQIVPVDMVCNAIIAAAYSTACR